MKFLVRNDEVRYIEIEAEDENQALELASQVPLREWRAVQGSRRVYLADQPQQSQSNR